MRLHDRVNMGFAIAVDNGIMDAVIPNAHLASFAEIAKLRVESSERAETGRLRSADVAQATFTVSKLGMYKVDQFNAIIRAQAGILALGAIVDRVVAVDGKPAVRPTVTLTLCCDHRVVDGARAAMFLDDVGRVFARPLQTLSG